MNFPPDRAPTLIDTPIPAQKVTQTELLTLLGRYRTVCAEAMREFKPTNATQREVLHKMLRLNSTLTSEIPVVMP